MPTVLACVFAGRPARARRTSLGHFLLMCVLVLHVPLQLRAEAVLGAAAAEADGLAERHAQAAAAAFGVSAVTT